MHRLKLFVLFLLVVPITVLATPLHDDVTVCSPTQKALIVKALQKSKFTDLYSNVTDAIKKLKIEKGGLFGIVEDVNIMQEDWWSTTTQSFPDCVEAQQITLTGGRVLDELLIASTMGQLSYSETVAGDKYDASSNLSTEFQYHIKQWTALQGDFIDMITALTQK